MEWSEQIPSCWEMSLRFVIKLERLPNQEVFSEEKLGLHSKRRKKTSLITVYNNGSSEKGPLSTINIYFILCV